MSKAAINVFPPRRKYRTKGEMQAIRDALYGTLADDHPATVRQIFYRLVSQGVIAKSESEYKETVIRLLGDMRRAGQIPYGWIADNTRWMRKPRTYSSLEHALQQTAQLYRRALWDNQESYAEVWLEKDALAGVIYDITAQWDVPLMVTRGYSSLSFLHDAALAISEQNKPTVIYYLGDHDPSGVDIPKVTERRLREMAPGVDLTFTRLAVNEDQIHAMGLPTRPTKKSDTRSKNFKGESVEVDAIPPAMLKEMVQGAIVDNLDIDALGVLETAEESEREILTKIAERMIV